MKEQTMLLDYIVRSTSASPRAGSPGSNVPCALARPTRAVQELPPKHRSCASFVETNESQ